MAGVGAGLWNGGNTSWLDVANDEVDNDGEGGGNEIVGDCLTPRSKASAGAGLGTMLDAGVSGEIVAVLRIWLLSCAPGEG
jgi:hypothetical protein